MGGHIVVVGGVAAGASAAAKARRVSEEVEITLIEAGPYISFANCGLPYYVGGEIAEREKLFVTTAEKFSKRFNVSVRTRTRVTAVDASRKCVTVAPVQSGGEGSPDGAPPSGTPSPLGTRGEEIAYDRLVLATGTVGVVPPVPGLERGKNVFTVRTVPDADAIVERLTATNPPEHAVVIGGGYIGLETAEQLLRRGLRVTVLEIAEQLLLALDPEMSEPVRAALVKAGAEVLLREGLAEITEREGRPVAVTTSGREIPFDLGILCVGAQPNVALAQSAGLELGETGAIAVDAFQRTSDACIYAAGDCAEIMHLVTGEPSRVPLAGPANKAGRVAGANAAMDLQDVPGDDPYRPRFRGALGTAGVRVCDVTAGVTGLTEGQAAREGIEAAVAYVHGSSHAGYYPDAKPLVAKLLYAPADGRLLGAQVVGGDGVDKRIDVFATAITGRMSVEDLEQLDLCYAPPFGSARDMLIEVGYAASNTRRGVMPAVTPAELFAELAGEDPPFVLDDRSVKEYEAGHVEGAVNIPVDELRGRIDEVPADRPVVVYCTTGYRSYVGQRVLMNHGRTNVRNLLGGYKLLAQAQVLKK
ncbi:MAG TPA: FAD-dependent oxidoreductase [Planctomycetota bacterium]|nr:FAD-dependent oxidoreductase [Planctomycetota bacterium]